MAEDEREQFFEAARAAMVEQIALHTQLVAQHIGKATLGERVLAVMGTVPRHEFVPAELRMLAYLDQPLPIGSDKTISQPFIVALMSDLLEVQADDRVLEIGTGLGYQSAVLSRLAQRVYSVEIIEELQTEAVQRLHRLGFDNVEFRLGDGSHGWPEEAPFDKVMVTAAPELIPPALLNQLKPGGRMVIPAGLEDQQALMLVEKDAQGLITTHELLSVRFSSLVLSH